MFYCTIILVFIRAIIRPVDFFWSLHLVFIVFLHKAFFCRLVVLFWQFLRSRIARFKGMSTFDISCQGLSKKTALTHIPCAEYAGLYFTVTLPILLVLTLLKWRRLKMCSMTLFFFIFCRSDVYCKYFKQYKQYWKLQKRKWKFSPFRYDQCPSSRYFFACTALHLYINGTILFCSFSSTQ